MAAKKGRRRPRRPARDPRGIQDPRLLASRPEHLVSQDREQVQNLQNLFQWHVQAISDFPPPQDVKQLQQFSGMVNFFPTFPSRYRPHATAAHRRAKRGPKDAGVAARRRRLRSSQGRPGGRGTTGAPSPERRALPSNRRLRHTRRRRASTA
jgi:hypothetical protein